MQREVIDTFADKRWADAVKTPGGSRLTYGVGKICSRTVAFTSYVNALEARTAWLVDGVEPQRALTRTDWPAVTDAQLDALAEQLGACR